MSARVRVRVATITADWAAAADWIEVGVNRELERLERTGRTVRSVAFIGRHKETFERKTVEFVIVYEEVSRVAAGDGTQ